MAYSPVAIHNSTGFQINGVVEYASVFCSNDSYHISANGQWTGPGRGACLVTKIRAFVTTPTGTVEANSYTSSGTSYSQFAIIQTGSNSFAVTRITNSMEGEVPSDYIEPTEIQK